MQTVSPTFLSAIRTWNGTGPQKPAIVLEFYKPTAEPGVNGFDPASSDFLFGLSKIKRSGEADGLTYRTRSYKRLIKSHGRINKVLDKTLNSLTADLSNMDRSLWAFERDYGFEGLRCVARMIDWNISDDLDDSAVLFTGRCEKIENFSRRNETARLTVKHILDTDQELLRRQFTPNDEEGRSPSDPEFEGFRFVQRQGSVQYEVKVKKRFLFFFSRTKTERRTLQYSSHSDVQSNTWVPLIIGRVQAPAIQLGYEDIGNQINFLAALADGYEKGIFGFSDIRSITPGFPITVVAEKLGIKGGTGNQINDDPSWVAAGIYSYLAYIRGFAKGTELSQDDPAPEIVAITQGLIMPVPDAAGDWVDESWSDNPVEVCRWALNSPNLWNLPDAWFDDVQNVIERDYCDHVLVDDGNTDTVLLPNSQLSFAGDKFKLYNSTGQINFRYWKAILGDEDRADAALEEAEYFFYNQFPYNSDDYGGTGEPNFSYGGATAKYRRRYTFNVRIAEQMKAYDFIHDVLFPSFNGYMTQSAKGKFAFKARRPIDHTFFENASAVDDDEIEVLNINPFVGYAGKLLIGANMKATSEVRDVTGTRYSAGGQTISVNGSGISVNKATLSGGTSVVAPNATITVSTNSGTKTITIDGYQLDYASVAGDTTDTIAGMIAGLINSHPVLNKSIKGTWNKTASTVLVESRKGVIELDSALEHAHDDGIADPVAAPTGSVQGSGGLLPGKYLFAYSYCTETGETLVSPLLEKTVSNGQGVVLDSVALPAGATKLNWYSSVEAKGVRLHFLKETDGAGVTVTKANLPKVTDRPEPAVNLTSEECHKIALAFTDRGNTRTGLTGSNMLKGTFKFPYGKRQKSVNQVRGKFRDASQDFELTPITVNDTPHQTKINKVNKKDINLAGIDNHHQASRIANQILNLHLDGDFFGGFASDGEALLLEEYDPICFTDESGDLKNEPCTVEDIIISDSGGMPTVEIIARRYRRWFYDDGAPEKVVRLPIVDNNPPNRSTEAPTIVNTDVPTNTDINLSVGDFDKEITHFKVEHDTSSDFDSANYEELIVSAKTNPIRAFEQGAVPLSKEGASGTETRFIKISGSTNGETFGDPSEPIEVTFADNGGSGGVGMNKPPSQLQVQWNEGTGKADLSWDRGDGTDNQTVQRKLNSEPESAWADVDTNVGTGAESYSQTIAKDDDSAIIYNYRVRDNTVEGWTNTASVTVPRADQAPTLAGVWDEANDEVDLTATPGDPAGSGDYTFEEKDEGDPDTNFAGVGTQASPNLSLSKSKGASPVGKTYRVKRAVPAGLYSPKVTVQIPANSNPPTLSSASWNAIDNKLDVSFVNNGGADDMDVEYSETGLGEYVPAGTIAVGAGSGQVTVFRDTFDYKIDVRIKQDDTGYSNVILKINIPGTGV